MRIACIQYTKFKTLNIQPSIRPSIHSFHSFIKYILFILLNRKSNNTKDSDTYKKQAAIYNTIHDSDTEIRMRRRRETKEKN